VETGRLSFHQHDGSSWTNQYWVFTMTKTIPMLALAAALAAGCATSTTSALPAGKFVTMSCAENKTFQVRMSDDARTARVRAHQGSSELDRQADGRYSGDGYVLNLSGEGGASLEHSGKSQGKACKHAV
jgi:hypothetical protein